jgi:hypothetical protein
MLKHPADDPYGFPWLAYAVLLVIYWMIYSTVH